MALTEEQKRMAMSFMPAPVAPVPAAPVAAPSGDISSGTASIAGAGIGAGAGLVGGLLAQAAAREREKRAVEFQGLQSSLNTKLKASQELSERQQEALGRLMNNFRSALVR